MQVTRKERVQVADAGHEERKTPLQFAGVGQEDDAIAGRYTRPPELLVINGKISGGFP